MMESELESELRNHLSRIADEVTVAPGSERHLLRKARKRRALAGVLAALAIGGVGGGVVFAGSTTDPRLPGSGPSETPSSTLTPSESPPPITSESEKEATRFGFGRVPNGWVNFCPANLVSATEFPESLVRDLASEFLRATNATNPSPAIAWRSMDPALQNAFVSEAEFTSRLSEADLEPKFEEWGLEI